MVYPDVTSRRSVDWPALQEELRQAREDLQAVTRQSCCTYLSFEERSNLDAKRAELHEAYAGLHQQARELVHLPVQSIAMGVQGEILLCGWLASLKSCYGVAYNTQDSKPDPSWTVDERLAHLLPVEATLELNAQMHLLHDVVISAPSYVRLTEIVRLVQAGSRLSIPGSRSILSIALIVLDLRSLEQINLHPTSHLLPPNARTLRTVLQIYLNATKPTSRRLGRVESWPEIYPSTIEQANVANLPLTPGVTIVQALAGTGKTTSVRALFKKNSKQFDCRKVYLVFNAAMAEAACASMMWPNCGWKDVRVKTMNALCKQMEVDGNAQAEAKFNDGEELSPVKVARLLDLQSGLYPIEQPKEAGKRKGNVSEQAIGNRVLKTLNKYMGSADDDFQLYHATKQAKDRPALPAAELIRLAKLLWEKIIDMEDQDTPFPFTAHIKVAQLRKEKVPFPGSKDPRIDLLVFDEAQDVSNAELDLVLRLRETARIVLIGDDHQRIYGFRSALGSWLKTEVDQVLSLSSSFRFGPEIAFTANTILSMKGEKLRIKGTGRPGSVHKPLLSSQEPPKDAIIIHRSNAGVLRSLIQWGLRNPRRRIYLKVRKDTSDQPAQSPQKNKSPSDPLFVYQDASLLARDVTRYRKYFLLRPFASWSDLKAEVEEMGKDAHPTLKALVDLEAVLKLPNFVSQLQSVKQCIVHTAEEADLILGVTHQLKGLEYSQEVILAPDYFNVFEERTASTPRFNEEFNLLYVAATRAKNTLILNPQLYYTQLLNTGQHNFYASPASPSNRCNRCKTRDLDLYISYLPGFTSCPTASPSTSNEHDEFLKHFATNTQDVIGQFDDSAFPCCLSCARSASYPPLADYAHFIELLDEFAHYRRPDQQRWTDWAQLAHWLEGDVDPQLIWDGDLFGRNLQAALSQGGTEMDEMSPEDAQIRHEAALESCW